MQTTPWFAALSAAQRGDMGAWLALQQQQAEALCKAQETLLAGWQKMAALQSHALEEWVSEGMKNGKVLSENHDLATYVQKQAALNQKSMGNVLATNAAMLDIALETQKECASLFTEAPQEVKNKTKATGAKKAR